MAKKEEGISEKPSFDLENVYDEQIAPLMTQIIEICKHHKLPMFATFLYANDVENDDAGNCTTFLLFEERPIPSKMMDLRKFLATARPAMRLRVRNKEGYITQL